MSQLLITDLLPMEPTELNEQLITNMEVSTSEGQVFVAEEGSNEEIEAESISSTEPTESTENTESEPTAMKRGLSDGSSSGLSPLCKRTFSLDGKEVTFENDPWYVGWMFSALDSMRKEFSYVSDMIAGHEAYKVETNNRLLVLETEKAEITSRVTILEEEKVQAKHQVEELRRELSEQKSVADEASLRMESFRVEWSQRAEDDAFQLTKVLRKLDEMEQYSSRECLILHGVPEKKTPDERRNEDTDAIIIEEIGTRLNVAISPEDIDRSHRLGKYKFGEGQKKGRPIIVKLVRHNLKSQIYKRKKLLKNSGLLVTERVTPRRSTFVRYAKEKCGQYNVWTSDGEIFCKLNEGPQGIQNMTDKFYMMETSIFRYYNDNGPDPGWF